MKKLIYLILLILVSPSLRAAENPTDTLRFRNNGEFRIMQITDTHFKSGKSASDAVVELIDEMILKEDVDLVVFTGDNVYSDGVMNALETQLRPFANNKTPFIVLFGNHDHQFDLSQEQQWDIIRGYPHNIQPNRPAGAGYPDFAIPIYSAKDNKVAQVIYNFDSHAGYRTRAISRYDWLRLDQIAWYRKTSKAYTAENGGNPVPSIMFLHIPLPEYAYAYDHNTRGNQTGTHSVFGTKKENVSCPKLNSGMFASIREMGDVRGIFCGHDHDNDFALAWKDVLLAYGRYSGGNTVYNHLGKNGVRIIVLHEGDDNIDTYIRLKGGEIINRCSFPADFQ